MVLCLQQIYQELSLYILFYTLPIIDKLLQCIHIVGTCFDQLRIFSKKFWSQSASSPTLL